MKEATEVLAFINDTGILVVLLAVVLLFGASRLPKLARNLGEAGKEFRKAQDDAAVKSSPDELVTISRAELDALAKGAPTEAQPARDPAS
jgi:TatA/E family protein of Tat protein translocase